LCQRERFWEPAFLKEFKWIAMEVNKKHL
jgi:hypothetical protein